MNPPIPSPDAPPLAWALWYAALGIPVFPVHAVREDGICTCPKGRECGRDTGKHPLTTHGLKDASTDPVMIAAWWDRWLRANIGSATGHVSGVLDIDGMDLETWQARTGFRLPSTWRARTGSGGEHLHFASAPSLAPRPDGPVTTIPASLVAWAERGAPLGQQAHAAFWLSCRLREHGADEHAGWALMERFAAACTPPADLTKLARIWRDSAKYQGYQPYRQLPEPTRPAFRVLPEPLRPRFREEGRA